MDAHGAHHHGYMTVTGMHAMQRDEIHLTLSGKDENLSDGKQDDEVEHSVARESDEAKQPVEEATDSKKFQGRGNCKADAV